MMLAKEVCGVEPRKTKTCVRLDVERIDLRVSWVWWWTALNGRGLVQ
jgi:hypothetical protein